jgi:hypothetical protein
LQEGNPCGISVNYVEGLVIEGNTVVRNVTNCIKSNLTDIYFTDGYGRSLTDAIFVSSCKNVEIKNNQINDLVKTDCGKTGFGTLTENVRIDGVKQPDCVADVLSGRLISGNQNDLGWNYGYVSSDIVSSGKYVPERFAEMTKQENGNWNIGKSGGPVIGKQTAIPGIDQSPVVRWTSSVTGNLTVTGRILPDKSSGGNNATCYFYVNGEKKYEYNTEKGRTDFNVDLGAVTQGSRIDFIVVPNQKSTGIPVLFNYKFLLSHDQNEL